MLPVLATPAAACPVCLGIVPQQPTLADELRAADVVVVARAAGAPGVFTVVSTVKGEALPEGQRIEAPGAPAGDTMLLTRAGADQTWKSSGEFGLHLLSFCKVLLKLPADAPRDDAAWAQRLELVSPFLGHLDERIARSAWAEWARAPYRIIRGQRMEPAKLRAWLNDKAQAWAQPMWLVLLGVNGDASDAARINEQLEAAWKKNDAALTAPLLTARIEREGEAAVAWLEEKYIRDRERTLDEIKAAVAALSVHGEVNEKLRPRILAACRVMLEQRRPLSGLVARDLAAWSDWSAAEHFEKLLASGEPVLPESRRAIMDYLDACRKQAAAPPPAPAK